MQASLDNERINVKKSTVFCAVLLSTLAAPALADGFRYVGGEAGWAYVGKTTENTKVDAAKTRDQLARETISSDRSRATADGWKWVGGEAGWLFVGQTRGGQQRDLAAEQ